jgi:hypothetical protein
MARAGRGKLVGINEESAIGITGVQRQHSVINILLGTFRMVTRCQKPASRVRGLASFQTRGLSIVIVPISIIFGDMLQDNAPITFNIDSPFDFGVGDVRGTKVAFGSDPVGGIIGRRTLWGSGVVVIVEGGFLRSNDVFNQVIGRLIGHIRVLFQENGILGNLVSDIVFRILGILNTIGKVNGEGTGRRGLGVTILVVRRGIRGRMVGHGMVRDWGRMRMGRGSKGQGGQRDHHGGDQLHNHGLLY